MVGHVRQERGLVFTLGTGVTGKETEIPSDLTRRFGDGVSLSRQDRPGSVVVGLAFFTKEITEKADRFFKVTVTWQLMDGFDSACRARIYYTLLPLILAINYFGRW